MPGNGKDKKIHGESINLRAYYLRFIPTLWKNAACMRIEIYGCKAGGTLYFLSYIHENIHTHTNVHMHAHTHAHATHAHTHVCTCTNTHKHAQTYSHIHRYIHTTRTRTNYPHYTRTRPCTMHTADSSSTFEELDIKDGKRLNLILSSMYVCVKYHVSQLFNSCTCCCMYVSVKVSNEPCCCMYVCLFVKASNEPCCCMYLCL